MPPMPMPPWPQLMNYPAFDPATNHVHACQAPASPAVEKRLDHSIAVNRYRAPTTQSIHDLKKNLSTAVPPHVARRKHSGDECVTLRAHGRMVQAGSLANAQELAGAFLKPRPGWIDEDRLVIRLFFKRFGTTTFINLHKLHQSIHPGSQSIRQGCSPECDNDLGAATVDLPAPDLHNLADRNRFVAAKVEDSFQDEVGVQAGGTEGRRVAGLEGEGEQGTRIECPMVIGITRQDKVMSQGFKVLGLRLRHARRVPRNVNWSGHGVIAIIRKYHAIRQTATAGSQMERQYWGRAIAALGEPP